ncbi:hypothetical protein O9G_006299 [Rozella allomycis CSF55]|uniref:Uncharacterized protein n=1 Tax=Rozella allomycis (strain CSF55) TaxID=988480 RepID=A0A075B1S2_ROZAC|nr:hypothetical protein O9G_006299 [Rozella allomycis CSF55]|eukprot:EPZ34738.1 hypothetical protein O9G_006299 [Rozella allomycis CSF55]
MKPYLTFIFFKNNSAAYCLLMICYFKSLARTRKGKGVKEKAELLVRLILLKHAIRFFAKMNFKIVNGDRCDVCIHPIQEKHVQGRVQQKHC